MRTRTRRERRRRGLGERLSLTAEEMTELREVGRALAGGAGRLSLRDALRQRENFVRQVEGGYGDEDEYENDLAVRGYLDEVMAAMPRLLDRVTAVIEPLDVRFWGATRVTSLPRVEGFDDAVQLRPHEEIAWWAFRVPRLWEIGPEEETELMQRGRRLTEGGVNEPAGDV